MRLRVAGLPVPEKIVTSNDITNGKPHPEPYARGAQLLGVAPQDCVVFEDAPAGIRSGKSAHARVVAFQTTERDDLLRAAGADWIVKDASSISLYSDPKNDGLSLLLRNPL